MAYVTRKAIRAEAAEEQTAAPVPARAPQPRLGEPLPA
jgi:hypothetical protein